MKMDRNKSTEKDLRDYLDNKGYFGRTAKFKKLKLKAVERPGWVQVFQFEVDAKRSEGDWETLFGSCRTDERSDLFDVEISADPTIAQQAFGEASKGLITHETARQQSPLIGLLFIAVVVSILGAGIVFFQKATNPKVLDIDPLTAPQLDD